MLYYTATTMETGGAIMVTGSHNPPDYNGFKMMLGRKPFFGAQIQDIGRMAREGDVVAETSAATRTIDMEEDYVKRLLARLGRQGSQAEGRVGQRQRLGGRCAGRSWCGGLPGEHTVLNGVIDGTFPAHHPDPTVPKNLEQLIAEVHARHADIGIAFDGDADRIGLVDDTGTIMFGDQLMVLLARDVLRAHPGATIIADVKASQVLFDEIARAGGKPLMWKTGHSLIKSKMAETECPLAGEMSGHIFFADKWYGFDDALYAAVRTLGIVARADRPLSALRKALPQVINTPEVRFDCDDVRKFKVIEEVAGSVASGGRDRVGDRRRARADRRRLVAAAGVQHPGRAGGARRGEDRSRSGGVESRAGSAIGRVRPAGAGLLRGARRSLTGAAPGLAPPKPCHLDDPKRAAGYSNPS